MTKKANLLAAIATAALFGTSTMPAFADDDQAEETRALNIQALAAARGQALSPMPDFGGVAIDEGDNGVGGPLFEIAPGPNDMGDAPSESDALDEDEPDVSNEPEDAAPPSE